MASSHYDGSSYAGAPTNLTPEQQSALLKALASNYYPRKESTTGPYQNTTATTTTQPNRNVKLDQSNNGAAQITGFDSLDPSLLDTSAFDETLNSFYDADNSFDWDLVASGGVKPDGGAGSSSAEDDENDNDGETHNKRRISDLGTEETEGQDKRQETDDKSSKKPGRKPISNEPTTKRKAQNRAAQRAFRERKEKHLKDLETKVEELEKNQELKTHENSMLKARIDSLQAELSTYRKKLSSSSSLDVNSIDANNINNAKFGYDLNQNGFNFNFPQFGSGGNNLTPFESVLSSISDSPEALVQSSLSPSDRKTSFTSVQPSIEKTNSNPRDHNKRENTTGSTFSLQSSKSNGKSSSASVKSPFSTGLPEFSNSSATSPDSYADSPGTNNKNNDNNLVHSLSNDFNYDAPSLFTGINSIDWMASQNDNLFNPALLEDFRDPQDNIMSNAFNDFLNSNTFPSPEPITTVPLAPAQKKQQPNLMEQVDRVAQTNEHPGTDPDFPCNELWERVQSSEKVINGELDMDELCSELKSKAKCTMTGRYMDATVLDDLLGPDTRPNAHQYVAALNAGYQRRVQNNVEKDKVKSESQSPASHASQASQNKAGMNKMFNLNASWFTPLNEAN